MLVLQVEIRGIHKRFVDLGKALQSGDYLYKYKYNAIFIQAVSCAT